MENFEEKNNLEQKQTNNILPIIITVVITTILIGITVYFLQSYNFKKARTQLQQNISNLEKELARSRGVNSELQQQLSVLEGQINNTKNSTKELPNDTGEDNNTTKTDVCSEGVIDKIFFSEKLYCAYKKSITEFNNGVETNIYLMDQKYEFGAILDLLSISPDGSILFFDYLQYHPGGLPETNAINIKTKTLLYPESGKDGICGRHIIWSPNKKYVLFAGGYFDGLQLKIALNNNIDSPVLVFETFDASSDDSIYWKDNDIFVFDPIEKDCNNYAKEIYQEIGLNCEMNEFKVKDYIK